MAWLFVPDMEVSNWELNESFQNQEPFVMWRGKPLQLNTLSKKWKKVNWMLRLSGLTSKHLTARLGVEKWIGSLEDSHANPIQLLENKWEKKILATSGQILSESLGKCDQDSYSLRTFQMSLKCDLIPLSLTLINWGIMLHGVLWRLPMLEPCTKEKGGSSWEYAQKWPTPTTKGWGHASEGQTENLLNKVKNGLITIHEAQSMLNLKDIKNHRTFKQMFPTPTTQANAQVAGQYDKRTGTTLAGFVKMFPTPTTRDWKGKQPPGYKERGYGPLLPDAIEETICGEEGSIRGGKLNPQWVAWLMGLPIGWINSEYWETE